MPNELFTSSGTWSKPPGVTHITVECVGAGAPGQSSSGPAQGGGGGDYARTADIDVTLYDDWSVTVGDPSGSVDSYFDSGFEVLAAGAVDGIGGGSGSTSIGDVVYSGGDGGNGGMDYGDGGGGGGGAGGGTAAGSNGGTGTVSSGGTGGSGGNGGSWLYGGGGGGGAYGGNGANGQSPGGGGGGGSGGHGSPGNGTYGAVKIHWVDPGGGSPPLGSAWWMFLTP